MKIAFIGQKGIPATESGVDKYVECLATGLAEINHKVFAYVSNNNASKNIAEYKKISLIHLPGVSNQWLNSISYNCCATLHALFQDFDVINYQSPGPAILSFLIKIFKPRTALIFTFHWQDYFQPKAGFLARVFLRSSARAACKITDKIIVVSRVLEKFIKEKFNQKTKVISAGVSISPTSEDYLLEDWGLHKKDYFLAVSQLNKFSGIQYLISAYNKLEEKKKINGKKLVIVGGGFYADDYINHLHLLAVGNKNIIFTGFQSGEVLKQLFSHTYLLVHPSDSSGFSATLLEAMACGKAVLASDITENMEQLGNNGFYFLKSNAKDLEEKLLRLINSPQIVKETGAKAREVVEKDYRWGKIAEKTEAVYRDVIFGKMDNQIIFHNTYGKNAKI
ncbi:MAG: glycosyltransferase family 4 protein [Patescibacteria group bacterium]